MSTDGFVNCFSKQNVTAEVRDLVEFILETAGYEVSTAASGEDALQIYSDDSIDLVITDIVMPGISGIELIQQLKRDYPDVRIIAMSGGSSSKSEDDLTQALQLGAEAVFHKPFGPEKLVETVRSVLKVAERKFEGRTPTCMHN